MDDVDKPNKNLLNTVKLILGSALMKVGDFDLQQWQKYIEQEIGFVLPDIQLQWLTNAIDSTAMANGLTVQQLWCQLPKNSQLRQQLLDKVLIHESRFFRHKPSIDFVTECALQHRRVSKTDALFRIWSVGCAGGQEVWSLAMSLAAQRFLDYTILGTDVSEDAIKNARLGQYDNRQSSLIPQSCQKFIEPLPAKNATNKSSISQSIVVSDVTPSMKAHWQVVPTLQPHVSFSVHNIFEPKPPTAHLQQVIICQNMLLYFRKFDQRDILTRLSEQCALGGYIILAPGEALFWRPSNMRRIAHPQVNVWQKISA
ncbi:MULTISPECIES: CheR family methyltransferase [unclassified Psychrobacter]|uniref:CheR family methyltransferase n=1 Tax=unclassified Psychrobacter TaxID=196806 RepID=UPI0025B2AD73|nr:MULTISPECIES: CheR family methyltransferase [unclassified Psychrobacter]MDN3452592.1 CheR family methyltransferase [Psychrobacter sp. APC 3350]MDN3502476.1 CheR family methyltransferase [Psychrobacter sp. 5A.1]